MPTISNNDTNSVATGIIEDRNSEESTEDVDYKSENINPDDKETSNSLIIDKVVNNIKSDIKSDKDEKKESDVTAQLKELSTKLEAVEELYNSTASELESLKQEKYLKQKGVSDDQLEFVAFKVGKIMTAEKTFEKAVDEYLEEHPLMPSTPPPLISMTAGQRPAPEQTEVDFLKDAYKKAQKLRNTAELSRLIRVAQAKNIKLF